MQHLFPIFYEFHFRSYFHLLYPGLRDIPLIGQTQEISQPSNSCGLVHHIQTSGLYT